MWTIAKEGLSETHPVLTLAELDIGAKYVFVASHGEERAKAPVWREASLTRSAQCVEVVRQSDREILLQSQGVHQVVALTDSVALGSVLGAGCVYLDITGLLHHVWAPILKTALQACSEVKVVYFEPERYKPHPSPSSTSQFDLSSGFRGVEPIPGFANLVGPPMDSKTLFVPFLGWEGPRARQVAMTLDPIPHTIPIIGLPGFRVDYPQVTVASNQDFLAENFAGKNVRFANASCPFEAYSALVDIRRDNPGSYLYVAPLGTKPHAVGAVWFALEHPQDTELMYDHPIRPTDRTGGVGTAHVYRMKG
jgi:hypothetical protein